MTSANLIRVLKDNLELRSKFEDTPVSVNVRYCEKFAKASIALFVEGQWQLFDVVVRPKGYSEALTIGG